MISELRVFPRDRPLRGGVPGLWRGEILGTRAPVPSGGLTSALLRNIRLPRYAAHAAAVVAEWRAAGVPADGDEQALQGLAESEQPGRARPKRRAGRPDRFYADLAAEYVRTLSESRRPVADIAKRRKLPPAQVRDMIHEARERQLLSPGRQGALGGYLLPRAEALLGIRRRPKPAPHRGTKRGVPSSHRGTKPARSARPAPSAARGGVSRQAIGAPLIGTKPARLGLGGTLEPRGMGAV